mmetsp:Transcript_28051/g.70486  ORF Transcript_28051/g.70486 Transcript_28051/m.70486 type:complete len:218 (-) Transcript_28051:118-771(-)
MPTRMKSARRVTSGLALTLYTCMNAAAAAPPPVAAAAAVAGAAAAAAGCVTIAVWPRPNLGPSICQVGPEMYPGTPSRLSLISSPAPRGSTRPVLPPRRPSSGLAAIRKAASVSHWVPFRGASSSWMNASSGASVSFARRLYPRISWMSGECTRKHPAHPAIALSHLPWWLPESLLTRYSTSPPLPPSPLGAVCSTPTPPVLPRVLAVSRAMLCSRL